MMDLEALDRHDDHYKKAVIEPIRIMRVFFTPAEFVGYLKGNILKYRLRIGLKGNEEDAKADMDKIRVYEEWLEKYQKERNIL